MIKKIDRPDWFLFTETDDPIASIDRWFYKHVEPVNKMLSEAIEVYSEGIDREPFYKESDCCIGTHKGYLIGIEPIKKDTAKDIVRDLVRLQKLNCGTGPDKDELVKRAKALLNSEDC